MFKLYNKLLFNSCYKCEISKSLFLCLTFQKSTLTVQNKTNKLKKTTSKYHHDSLDVYTNILLLENTIKWKIDTFLLNKLPNVKMKSNTIIKSYDNPDYLMIYLQQCLDGNCKVSKVILTQFMLTMTRYGQINGLILIKKINEKYGYCITDTDLHMNFAKAYWVNGNLDNMFTIFETFYPLETVKVNYILEPIIYTIVNLRGIASVVLVSKFVNTIVMKHEDYYPMCILWKYLFLSELYNDNIEAEKLMKNNSNLIKHIEYLVPIIVNKMLKKHKTDCVQRLMIIMLKYNQMDPYQMILKSLFDYYCKYYLYGITVLVIYLYLIFIFISSKFNILFILNDINNKKVF